MHRAQSPQTGGGTRIKAGSLPFAIPMQHGELVILPLRLSRPRLLGQAPKLGGVPSMNEVNARRGGSMMNHPVCASKVAPRHFLGRAATPPNLGGELIVISYLVKFL